METVVRLPQSDLGIALRCFSKSFCKCGCHGDCTTAFELYNSSVSTQHDLNEYSM